MRLAWFGSWHSRKTPRSTVAKTSKLQRLIPSTLTQLYLGHVTLCTKRAFLWQQHLEQNSLTIWHSSSPALKMFVQPPVHKGHPGQQRKPAPPHASWDAWKLVKVAPAAPSMILALVFDPRPNHITTERAERTEADTETRCIPLASLAVQLFKRPSTSLSDFGGRSSA